jgi:hypothetical protein
MLPTSLSAESIGLFQLNAIEICLSRSGEPIDRCARRIVLDSIEAIVELVAAHEFKQRSPVGVLSRREAGLSQLKFRDIMRCGCAQMVDSAKGDCGSVEFG